MKKLFLLIVFLALWFPACQKEVVEPQKEIQNPSLTIEANKTADENFILFPTFHFQDTGEGLTATFVDQSVATGVVLDGCQMGAYVTVTYVSFIEDTISHEWTPFIIEGEDNENGGGYVATNKSEYTFKYPKNWEKALIHLVVFGEECNIVPEESAIGAYYEGIEVIRGCIPLHENAPEYCDGDPVYFEIQNGVGQADGKIEVINPVIAPAFDKSGFTGS